MKNSQKIFENKAESPCNSGAISMTYQCCYRMLFYQQAVQTLLLYASQVQQEQRRFLWLFNFFGLDQRLLYVCGLNQSFLNHLKSLLREALLHVANRI